jgi:hypothetical protein
LQVHATALDRFFEIFRGKLIVWIFGRGYHNAQPSNGNAGNGCAFARRRNQMQVRTGRGCGNLCLGGKA